MKSKGIATKSGKQLTKDQIKRILVNPFYYGHFRYCGEVYEGKHKAIIEKRLFDRVQTVIAKRCHPQKGATAPQVFCGLLTCATCNMAITAEKKIKHQRTATLTNISITVAQESTKLLLAKSRQLPSKI